MPSLIRTFGAARMAVGAVSWIAPTFTARIFGLDPDGKQPVVTQLFGARDFALGLLTATTSGRNREQVLRVGVAIDAIDAAASLRQIRAGTLSTHGAIGVGAGAALFALIGAAALRADAPPAPA
jgi:hypothetical protein